MAGSSEADTAVLVAARRRVALLVSAGVVLGVLLASVVTWVAVVRVRDDRAEEVLRDAVARADDAIDPPPETWLFIRAADGTLTSSPGAPPGLPDVAALDRVAATGQVDVTEVHAGGREFRSRTGVRGRTVVQAVQDLGLREAERNRLTLGLGLACLVGLGVAMVWGWFLASRATAPLADALARQRRFVADASHELRTPLTRLALRAQLLDRGLPTDAPAACRDDAHRLVADAQGLAEVLDDLLVSAQLRHYPGAGADVDLAALASEVVAADRVRANHAGVRIDVDSRPVPPVMGNRSALRRALSALVDNALSHAGNGGSVLVRVQGERTTVRVDVEDDGGGLDVARLAELLRPFARGHTDARRFGLGLALVSEVVDAHGGRLQVARAAGGGACFSLLLPTTARLPAR